MSLPIQFGGKTRLDVDLGCNFLTFCKLQSTDMLSVGKTSSKNMLSVGKTSSKKEEEKNGCCQVLARVTPLVIFGTKQAKEKAYLP